MGSEGMVMEEVRKEGRENKRESENDGLASVSGVYCFNVIHSSR